jgi:Transcriptional regulator
MKKTYAQIEETKQWILEAFIQLIHTISYNKITITSICEKAGVPRSTFYRYFNTKEDILEDYIQYFFETMSYELKQYSHITVEDFIKLHFSFFKDNSSYFKALKKIHCEYIFFDYISNEQLYYNFHGDNKNNVLYHAIFFTSIIFNWVISQNQPSIEYMSHLVMNLLSKDVIMQIIPIFLNAHSKLT